MADALREPGNVYIAPDRIRYSLEEDPPVYDPSAGDTLAPMSQS
jgi:hypothetical protein